MEALVIPYAISSYTVLVHQAEEGGYWGEVLERPGCVSQGETLEEFRRNIREALEAVMEADSQEPQIHIYEQPVSAEKDFVGFRMSQFSRRKADWVSATETWTATQ